MQEPIIFKLFHIKEVHVLAGKLRFSLVYFRGSDFMLSPHSFSYRTAQKKVARICDVCSIPVNTLVNLFDRMGLQTNVGNTVGMVCCP